MAASLTTSPTSPGYQSDNNFVEITTDEITLAPAVIRLDLNGGPTTGQEITFEWAGISLTMTAAATVSEDGLSIPEKDPGDSIAEYAAIVWEVLRQNNLLASNWTIKYLGTVGAYERIELTYIDPIVLDVTVTENFDGLLATVTDGVAYTTEENLNAYLKVYEAAADPNDDALLVSLHAPYNIQTAKATFDLKNIFDLSPHLPTETSIDPIIFTTWPHGEASSAYQKYYLRYSEKSGIPALAKALKKSADYYMLHGGSPGDQLSTSTLALALIQHAYLRADSGTFSKPVGLDQPDWVYIWTKAAFTSCRVEVVVTWDNGDETTHAASGSAFALDQYKLYWFASGPLQHNISGFAAPSGATDPVAYNWRLLGDAGSGEILMAQVVYSIHCGCHPWNMYLLMDNGKGGLESVYVKGRVANRYDVQRSTARKMRFTGHNVSDGDLLTFNAEGRQVFEINTGWHESWYIEHIRQLLLGQLWIVDTVNDRFLKVVCETDSVDVKEDDQDLFSMSLTIRSAWFDNNQHL